MLIAIGQLLGTNLFKLYLEHVTLSFVLPVGGVTVSTVAFTLTTSLPDNWKMSVLGKKDGRNPGLAEDTRVLDVG